MSRAPQSIAEVAAALHRGPGTKDERIERVAVVSVRLAPVDGDTAVLDRDFPELPGAIAYEHGGIGTSVLAQALDEIPNSHPVIVHGPADSSASRRSRSVEPADLHAVCLTKCSSRGFRRLGRPRLTGLRAT